MSSPYLTEDQCSHEFYLAVRNSTNIFPIRTHGTKIEEKEGIDVIYVVQDAMERNVKVVLVQEKAPYPPPFTFKLKKKQHNTLWNRQNTFRYRAYFYGFFCVQLPSELPNIMGRTVHFEVDKIPLFSKTTYQVKASPNPFYVYCNSRRRRGYHFVEILMRLRYCRIGLSKSDLPKVIKDLKKLIEEKARFYLIVYDKDERDMQVVVSSSKPES